TSESETWTAPHATMLAYGDAFFSYAVHHFAQMLGHVKSVRYQLAVRQLFAADQRVNGAHVGAVRTNPRALSRRKHRQALLGRLAIATLHDRQHAWMLRIRQVAHHGHVQFVSFLQAQLVQADAGDRRIRRDRPLRLQTLLENALDQLGGDPETPRHFLDAESHQQFQHVLLEAVGVRRPRPFERRGNLHPLSAARALMQRRLIDPESRLTEQVQVPHRQNLVLQPHVRRPFLAALGTNLPRRQIEIDLEDMRPPMPLVTANRNPIRQIDLDFHIHAVHDHDSAMTRNGTTPAPLNHSNAPRGRPGNPSPGPNSLEKGTWKRKSQSLSSTRSLTESHSKVSSAFCSMRGNCHEHRRGTITPLCSVHSVSTIVATLLPSTSGSGDAPEKNVARTGTKPRFGSIQNECPDRSKSLPLGQGQREL